MNTTENSIERLESGVRSYCRSFPAVFETARGSEVFDTDGNAYLDFLAGAGALSYGHNDPDLRDALVDYLTRDGIVHSLDLTTRAKVEFLETLEEIILRPRDMDYRVMFPGPTGTNAVEAALKLARKVTGRTEVVSFTNGFHGMTLGALSVTGNRAKRAGAGVPLGNATHVPFDGYLGADVNTVEHLERLLNDGSSGLDKPAAVILETIQAEGGIHVASPDWLREVARITREAGAMLIVDDIQVGCGRTGSFFSFEETGIEPDLICLSKSLSGFGLPLSVVLIRPGWDQWSPGEHNGTFRGHNAAFVTATAALRKFWGDSALSRRVVELSRIMGVRLAATARGCDAEVRGRGFIQGIAFADPDRAGAVSAEAYKKGLIVETAGPDDEVLKLLPPLVIERDELERGLRIIDESVDATRTEGEANPAIIDSASTRA